MNHKLLKIIACPICHGQLLFYTKNQKELICISDKIAYPIKDGIPVLIKNRARILSLSETDI
ncbi:Trm112 family protein [Candidatus Erwinia haradaeae]|uniref:UPF0434 protein ERCIPICE3303_547 n=1 Tax=Candidatus Erwinia haradaeae TaxID=1922217 RepID=A0A803GD36_9GAMM|nr:Trm112 family protein [Candidatus Erwinia haradaeae]VFP88667.1 UPF0434 protein YcaR [Candidatus Erwinia haradaeae]